MEWNWAKERMQRLLQLGAPVGIGQLSPRPVNAMGLAVATGLLCSTGAMASFASPYGLSDFTLTNVPGCGGQTPNGSAVSFDGGLTVLFTGSESGSGCPTTTTLTISAVSGGTVSFSYSYALADDVPGLDIASYIVGSTVTPIATFDGDTGSVSFAVLPGQLFGFQIDSDDQGGTGALTISDFTVTSGVPEPGTLGLALASLGVLGTWRWRVRCKTKQEILSNELSKNS